MDNLCSFCSKELAGGEIHILGQDDQMLKTIRTCLSQTVPEGDRFPKSVCDRCFKHFSLAYQFLTTGKHTQLALQEFKKAKENGNFEIFCARMFKLDEQTEGENCPGSSSAVSKTARNEEDSEEH